ncbi:hypothetical protein BC831DRAFT_395620 [Entophlyctis helioformis]|nr:hypothetical protein BC831DRAFT_395620 [Entophlyctis helioformis]
MMRVLGREAVLNPTMVEAKVREQMAARKKKHDALIAASKLTDEQRRDKLRNKLLEDTSLLSHVCVFRVKNLSHPQHKFKVDKNAEQYNLTGTAILYTDFSVVIVEGGPKGIKAYKKLMLRRIDWTATKDDDGGADANAHAVSSDDMPNRCDLVWEGEVKERSFRTFRFKALPTEAMIREFLGRINATHYWDAARNYAPDAGDASVRL